MPNTQSETEKRRNAKVVCELLCQGESLKSLFRSFRKGQGVEKCKKLCVSFWAGTHQKGPGGERRRQKVVCKVLA